MAAISRRDFQSSFRETGSSPVVGSSKKVTSASAASTVATMTFLFWPLESLLLKSSAFSSRPTFARASAALALASPYEMPRQRRYEKTLCLGVIHGMARASWGIMPIISLSFRASLITSMPFMVAEPEVGSRSVASIRTRVVFPAPFIPMREKTP